MTFFHLNWNVSEFNMREKLFEMHHFGVFKFNPLNLNRNQVISKKIDVNLSAINRMWFRFLVRNVTKISINDNKDGSIWFRKTYVYNNCYLLTFWWLIKSIVTTKYSNWRQNFEGINWFMKTMYRNTKQIQLNTCYCFLSVNLAIYHLIYTFFMRSTNLISFICFFIFTFVRVHNTL